MKHLEQHLNTIKYLYVVASAVLEEAKPAQKEPCSLGPVAYVTGALLGPSGPTPSTEAPAPGRPDSSPLLAEQPGRQTALILVLTLSRSQPLSDLSFPVQAMEGRGQAVCPLWTAPDAAASPTQQSPPVSFPGSLCLVSKATRHRSRREHAEGAHGIHIPSWQPLETPSCSHAPPHSSVGSSPAFPASPWQGSHGGGRGWTWTLRSAQLSPAQCSPTPQVLRRRAAVCR